MFTYPHSPECGSEAERSGAKRSDVPYGHASMLPFGEGNEATKLYNEYTNFVPFFCLLLLFSKHFVKIQFHFGLP